jgi:hypothetical protein
MNESQKIKSDDSKLFIQRNQVNFSRNPPSNDLDIPNMKQSNQVYDSKPMLHQ